MSSILAHARTLAPSHSTIILYREIYMQSLEEACHSYWHEKLEGARPWRRQLRQARDFSVF